MLIFRRDLTSGVAHVHGADRLDQKSVRLLVGLRAVLDAVGDDKEVTRREFDRTIAQLNRDPHSEHQ